LQTIVTKCLAVRLNLALKFQLKIVSGFEYTIL